MYLHMLELSLTDKFQKTREKVLVLRELQLFWSLNAVYTA
jgi:hypothetical protein